MPENVKTLSFQKSFFLLLLFYSGCFLVFFAAEHFFSDTNPFIESNLLNWDAMHYSTIMKEGYRTGMVAFFPLFPFTWGWLPLSPLGICIFNGLVFIASFAWLASVFQFQLRNLLLLASIPSMIFMFLPFSESMFFFAVTMTLIGYKKDNLWLTITGIFLAGLSRPVATIFIPAIIIVEYLMMNNNKLSFQRLIAFITSVLISLFLVFLLQYIQTGKWFTFFEVQRGWDNYWRLPSFPLSSWAGGFIVRVDSFAFFFGITALATLIYVISKKIKSSVNIINDKALLLSICYLGLLSILVLFTKGGAFNSFNRYLFATAFFVIALNSFLESKILSQKNLLILFICSSVFWFLFASYVHIQYLLKFELMSAYLVVLMLARSAIKRVRQLSFIAILSVNTVFFVIFFHRFISGNWIG